MLPTVSLPALRRTAVAAIAALSLAAVSAAPANAWGKNEQNFVKGVLATVAVGAIIKESRKQNRTRAYQPEQRYYAPQPEPRYYAPQHAPVYAPAPNYYRAPIASAFSEYSPASKRAIQQRLRAYGYYRGSIDGVYGPGTRAAIEAYARDTNARGALDSRDGAVRLMNALLT